jgi:hypothetical protein
VDKPSVIRPISGQQIAKIIRNIWFGPKRGHMCHIRPVSAYILNDCYQIISGPFTGKIIDRLDFIALTDEEALLESQWQLFQKKL